MLGTKLNQVLGFVKHVVLIAVRATIWVLDETIALLTKVKELLS